ncbi:MAG: hypothetical protein ACK5N8_04595 [Alphaproteobacteria bacterium]
MTKIKALITLVVGKGIEVLPNEITDVSELEAQRLIANKFAEELPKNSSRSNKQQAKSQSIVPPPEDTINQNGEDELQGEEDDSDEQGDD